MKEPPQFDLDPKYVRRRNHPGWEPIFQPGGLRILMARLLFIAIMIGLGLLVSPIARAIIVH